MTRKRHKPEQIVAKLRQVDVVVSQGRSVADAIRTIAVTEVTYSGKCRSSCSPRATIIIAVSGKHRVADDQHAVLEDTDLLGQGVHFHGSSAGRVRRAV